MRNGKWVFFPLMCLASLAVSFAGSVGAWNKNPEAAPGQIATAGWLPGSWAHRIRLTVKPDFIQGTGVLLDFPVLLRLGAAEAHVFAGANANGSDLRITKGDGVTVLGHEVVSFDLVQKQAEIWFRADSLAKTQNTFYLYYGNPAQTTFPPAGAAWNSKYVAVYHFAETPGLGVLRDWGPRGNHANAAAPGSNWTASDVAPGAIGQAWNFNGTTHYISGNAISTPDSSFVIGAWLKLPSRSTDFSFQSNPGYWHVSAQINETHRQPHFNAANPWRDLRWGPDPLPDDDQFHQFTWVFDGDADTILFYFDGVQQPAIPWSLDPSLAHFYTGYPINPNHNQGVGVLGPMYWNGLDLMTGPGDEFHLSERTHSGNWIRTEYRNQRDAAGFYVFGSEENAGSVPVVLLGFTALREEGLVRLRWEIASADQDLAGFWVFRGDAGERVRLTPELLTGGPRLEWTDIRPPAQETRYWLGAVSRTSDVHFWGPVLVGPAVTSREPLVFVGHSSPNPFAESTRLPWSARETGRVAVRIIDMAGGVVITLFDAVSPAGDFQALWNGRDVSGRRVSPGVYFFSVESRAMNAARKVLLLP